VHVSQTTHNHIRRVGQNRIYTPYMTTYLVISLQMMPYINRMYMVLANPTCTHNCMKAASSQRGKKEKHCNLHAEDHTSKGHGRHPSMQNRLYSSHRAVPFILAGLFVHIAALHHYGSTDLMFTLCFFYMCRVGQNHIYTVCIQYFWQGIYHIYGHIRCIYTVLANPIYVGFLYVLFLYVVFRSRQPRKQRTRSAPPCRKPLEVGKGAYAIRGRQGCYG